MDCRKARVENAMVCTRYLLFKGIFVLSLSDLWMKSVACSLLLILVLGQNVWLPPTSILSILLQTEFPVFNCAYFHLLLPYIWQLGVAMWLNESIICDFQNVFLRRGFLFACCLPFCCMELVLMTGMPAFILGSEDHGLELGGACVLDNFLEPPYELWTAYFWTLWIREVNICLVYVSH